MRGLNLTPKKKRNVKRKLMLGNALLSELRKSREVSSRKARRPLHSIIAGKVTKKYRLISALSKRTGFSRNSLQKCNKKCIKSVKEVRKSLTKDIESEVIHFLGERIIVESSREKQMSKRIQTGQNSKQWC